jgi:hypothetical protein
MLLRRILICLAVCSILPYADAVAQRHAFPQTREGLWIGGGLGVGQLSVSTPAFEHWTGETMPSNALGSGFGVAGSFRIGGTLSPHLLVGLENNGWIGETSGAEVTPERSAELMGIVSTATAYYYPSAQSGLFLKAGLGVLYLSGEAFGESLAGDGQDDVRAYAPSMLVGVGYDFRIGKKVSLTSALTVTQSSRVTPAEWELGQSAVRVGARTMSLQVGLTYH